MRIPLNLLLWLSFGGTRDVRSSKCGLSLISNPKVHKSGRQIAEATKFCTEAANICGSWRWYFMSPFWFLECWNGSWILEDVCSLPCINTTLEFTWFKNRFSFDKESRLLICIWYRGCDKWSYTAISPYASWHERRHFYSFLIAVDLRLFDVDRYMRQVSEEIHFQDCQCSCLGSKRKRLRVLP